MKVENAAKILPWRAQPLAEAAKQAKFRETMNLHAERVVLGRSAVITGWSVGAFGAVCLAASIAGWMTMLPLKTTEVKFFVADKTTGIISQPVSLQDAPKSFSDATNNQYLKQYIMAREDWVPDMDAWNDHLTKLMSTPAEQERYDAWRLEPTSPIRAVGRFGHVMVDDFRFHKQASGKDGTIRYLVQFDRTVTRVGLRDTPRPAAWSATVDFQWHPEAPMKPSDRDSNPGGFQVISYSATPDVQSGGGR